MPSTESHSNNSDSLLLRIVECRICGRRPRPAYELRGWNYEVLSEIGVGGYGKVYRCCNINTGRIVAIKQIVLFGVNEAVPANIIREVSLLKELDHVNIVRLLDVKSSGKCVNLVFEHLDFDLDHYITSPVYPNDSLTRKRFLHQILSAVAYCHSHNIIHRDLKPKNLLIDYPNKIIKLADFGLAREFGDPDMLFTEQVATWWYRAPEMLLNARQYSSPVDLWSVGCIFGEMVIGRSIFRSTNYRDELEAIFSVLGTPTEETWPGVTELCAYLDTFPKFEPMDLAQMFADLEPDGINLLSNMLCLDPNRRISAEAALRHAYFNDLNLVSSCSALHFSYIFLLFPCVCELNHQYRGGYNIEKKKFIKELKSSIKHLNYWMNMFEACLVLECLLSVHHFIYLFMIKKENSSGDHSHSRRLELWVNEGEV